MSGASSSSQNADALNNFNHRWIFLWRRHLRSSELRRIEKGRSRADEWTKGTMEKNPLQRNVSYLVSSVWQIQAERLCCSSSACVFFFCYPSLSHFVLYSSALFPFIFIFVSHVSAHSAECSKSKIRQCWLIHWSSVHVCSSNAHHTDAALHLCPLHNICFALLLSNNVVTAQPVVQQMCHQSSYI